MADLFRKKSFTKNDIEKDDIGVSMQEAIKLLDNSKFKADFEKHLNLNNLKKEFIAIPGAFKLVNTILEIEKKFEKFDVETSIQNINITYNDNYNFSFSNIVDLEAQAFFESDEFVATPVYSSHTDFFSDLYSMDRYAKKLIANGHKDLVFYNFDYLKKLKLTEIETNKVYRIIRDTNNQYYLRAITSRRYFDYNNRIAAFIGLITLHNEMKSSKAKFFVQKCEYNESYIRIFFKSNKSNNITKVGNFDNIIEVSNDEIKREALRFNCIYSLNFEGQSNNDMFFIKPKKAKSSILSIKHSVLPATALNQLSELSNYTDIEKELLDDIKEIAKIKKPDEIKFLVRQKIDKAKTSDIAKYKKNLLDTMSNKVDSITELLEMFNKLDLLTEDIDAKEYLRYIVYEALVYKR